MAEARLLRFIDIRNSDEFVVIDTTAMTIAELEAEYEGALRDSIAIHGDFSRFPNDRELREP